MIETKQSEEALIGAVVRDNSVFWEVAKIINSDDFFHHHLSQVWSDIDKLMRLRGAYSLSRLSKALSHYIGTDADNEAMQIVESAFSSSTAPADAETIRNESIRRNAERRLMEGLQKIRETEDPQSLARECGAGLASLSVRGQETAIHASKWGDVLRAGLAGSGAALSTGLHGLTFTPGELTILAARPGLGKTTLALQIGEHIAENYGPVMGFFMEMTPFQIAKRSVCRRLNVSSDTAHGDYLERLIPKYEESMASIPFTQDWKDRIDVRDMVARVTAAHSREPLSMVVVDYLQRMRCSSINGRRPKDAIEEISEGVNATKEMCKDLNIPCLALAQLNRDKADDERPSMTELRGSGELEQTADNIWMMYRSGMTRENLTLVQAKRRDGLPVDIVMTARYDKYTFSVDGIA